MAWPGFSETTFAFAFIRELETLHSATMLLPFFLSQQDEADKGYDAEVDLNGALVFFQFKRSEVMTHSLAHEFASGKFKGKSPVFRMHLRKKNAYAQHAALRDLEDDGYRVLYATSGAVDRNDLTHQYAAHQIMSQGAMFSPNEIDLPDTTQEHYVSFRPSAPFGWLFSQEGRRFRREIPNQQSFLDSLEPYRRNDEQNRELLRQFLVGLDQSRLGVVDVPALTEGPVPLERKAAIHALMYYDSQIALVP